MQPWLQNGAWGSEAGFPHSGQGLALSGFGMASRDGERRVGAQADGAAELAGEGFEPRLILFEHRDYRGVGGQAARARSGCSAAFSAACPGNAIGVGGNPARVIRRRYESDDVERLLRAAWWDWPPALVTEHAATIMSGTPARVIR